MIRSLLAAAFLLHFAVLPAAAQLRQSMLLDDKTASTLEVTAVFSLTPPTGYLPVRVKAINNTGAEFPVNMNTVAESANQSEAANELETRFSFTAPAGKTTEREFLVPLCTNFFVSGYSNPELHAKMQAAGLSKSFVFRCGSCGDLPFTAFSNGLAAKTLSDITGAVKGGREGFACLYEPAMLSADWRGCSGLDVLAMSSDEWAALQPAVKNAVLQWVKLGGSLNVYSKPGGADLTARGIPVQGRAGHGPSFGGDDFALGSGRVCDLRWDGTALDEKVTPHYDLKLLRPTGGYIRRQEYAGALSVYESSGRYNADTPAPLVAALGEKNFAAWQVGLILFIFGIMVGPVNLFYFARKGRRHRLFFTTPIISLSAAVLLLVVIFFQDGTGGKGQRAALIYLDSAENSAFVHQLQVCRTGVLFGSSFSLEDNTVLNTALLPDSRWTRLKGFRTESWGSRRSNSAAEPQRYTVQDKNRGGDWFQSRSEQAQILDSVQSTRGRLELKPGSNPPVITSTIAAPLHRICYVDNEGKTWASPGKVTAGTAVTLTDITGKAFREWRNDATSTFPPELRNKLKAHGAKNFFYAASTDPKAGMVETLDSIAWEGNAVFLYGPLQ